MTSQRVALPAVRALVGSGGGNKLVEWVRGPLRELQSVGQYRSGGVPGLLLTNQAGRQTLVVPTDHAPTSPVDFVLVCPKPERVLDGIEKPAVPIETAIEDVALAPR